MKQILKQTTFLIMFLLISCKQNTNKENVSLESKHIENIENGVYPLYNVNLENRAKSIPKLMKEANIIGLSMAFVNNGEVEWTQCYGYANLRDSIKMQPNTILRAASLSKPLTAIAALRLVEMQELNMDEDINSKLKGWKLPETELAATSKVTIRNLIGHRSGMNNAVHPGFATQERQPSNEEILSGQKLHMPARIISVPGEHYQYSNLGYMTLSELLMDVTSKDFDQLMDELILQPCRMTNSTFNQNISERLNGQLAIGYEEDQQPMAFYTHPSVGAGAMWTTPSDLGKFIANVLNTYQDKTHNGLITHEMTKQVFSKSPEKLGFNKWYDEETLVFRNDGSIPGFNCFIMGAPSKQQAVVVMLNTNNSKTDHFLGSIGRAVAKEYNWKIFEPHFHNIMEIPLEDLEGFEGIYVKESDSIYMNFKNGNLVVQDERSEYILRAIETSSFIQSDQQKKYDFNIDSSGVVRGLVMYNELGDRKGPYHKLF